jgi:hypothetical protein
MIRFMQASVVLTSGSGVIAASILQASAIDTSNFDQVFTSEIPLDSVVEDHNLSQTMQQRFAGFSYDGAQQGPTVNGAQSVPAPRSIG